jgi:ATP-binding cassette subfamily F protein 3
MLRGELHAGAGDVEVPAKWIFAHVAQETPAVDQPAIEYVLDGDAELRAIESDLRASEHAGDGVRLATLQGSTTTRAGTPPTVAPRSFSLASASAQHASVVRSFPVAGA